MNVNISFPTGGSSRKIAARQQVKDREDEKSRNCSTHKVSRSSQAETSMNYCESCTLAGEAVLQAINALERVFTENKLISAAVTERDKSREDIYERTQWAVMSRLTKGIETDVGTALASMRECNLKTEATRQHHEEAIRDLRAGLTRQEKRTDALQAKNSELEDALETVNEELERTNEENITRNRENEELERTLESTRKLVVLLTDGNNILQSQTGTLAESKLELEKTVIRLRKEAVDTRDAYLETERRFQMLLDETRKENDSLKEEHKREVGKLQQEIEVLRMTMENQKDAEKMKNINDNNSCKAFKGKEMDPIADMSQQLITNREKIEVLTRQNERLSKTLLRLKEYRMLGQTDSVEPKNGTHSEK
ncbi:PREDICTED: paramyosin-like [Dufourea novaeangliae]|uniref:paramyosin-like n=1 Tax=Dufourea novaeangliae TaxID=178035 RepID=UPI0007672343|nr:PREDICTED: paramyosin-like [Dufourea novaeangliae]